MPKRSLLARLAAHNGESNYWVPSPKSLKKKKKRTPSSRQSVSTGKKPPKKRLKHSVSKKRIIATKSPTKGKHQPRKSRRSRKKHQLRRRGRSRRRRSHLHVSLHVLGHTTKKARIGTSLVRENERGLTRRCSISSSSSSSAGLIYFVVRTRIYVDYVAMSIPNHANKSGLKVSPLPCFEFT